MNQQTDKTGSHGPRIALFDDGTLDTVIGCVRCGRELTRASGEWWENFESRDEAIRVEIDEWTLMHKCPVDRRVLTLLELLNEGANGLEGLFLRTGADSPYFDLARRVDAVVADLYKSQLADGYDFDIDSQVYPSEALQAGLEGLF